MGRERLTDHGKLVDMGELDTFLGNVHRDEHYDRLIEMPDRDLCEMVRAHFESHKTLPGEKAMKDRVNGLLKQDGDNLMDEDAKKNLARAYANTRIRETSFIQNNLSVEGLKREYVDMVKEGVIENFDEGMKDQNTTYIYKVKAELQTNNVDVYVMAEKEDGGLILAGTLPDKFLSNNPMNVNSCEAEIQLVDYSNGKMKNVSARVVVDTDLMSGDVLDLSDDMLDGLKAESSMEQ